MRYPQIGALIKTGIIGRTYGKRGGLKIYPRDTYLEDVLNAEFLFLEIAGSRVPFYVNAFEVHGDLVVYFEDIENPQDAASLISAEVFLPESSLSTIALEGSQLQFAFLEGYQMEDKAIGNMGRIRQVIDLPQQEMAVILKEGKEILIPLTQAFILDVDRDNQTVLMDLPAGLVETQA